MADAPNELEELAREACLAMANASLPGSKETVGDVVIRVIKQAYDWGREDEYLASSA